MSIKVNYKGAEILDYAENGTKTLKTGGKYCEGDISITNTQDGGITPTGSIEITENGTYDVTEKASAVVNVSGGGESRTDVLTLIFKGLIPYIKLERCPVTAYALYNVGSNSPEKSTLRFFSIKNSTSGNLTEAILRQQYSLNYVRIDNVSYRLSTKALYSCSALKSFIIDDKRVVTMQSVDVLGNSKISSGTGFVYVPDVDTNGEDLPSKYKVATNWSTYAEQIKGYGEADEFSADTNYSIGDVCQYNGKFYGYCKEDLTSSTGNAPSGTTSDNPYWEYINDITT